MSRTPISGNLLLFGLLVWASMAGSVFLLMVSAGCWFHGLVKPLQETGETSLAAVYGATTFLCWELGVFLVLVMYRLMVVYVRQAQIK